MNDTVDERVEMTEEKPKAKKKGRSAIEKRIEEFIDTNPGDQVKVTNVFDNFYRVNVYSFDAVKDLFFKKASISASYFIAEHADGTLEIEE